VQGIAIVQAYRREAACAADYDEINRGYRDANRASIKYDALLYSIVESVSAGCIALVLYFAAVRAGWLRAGGAIDPATAAAHVGTVVAFYDYIQRFFVPIRDLSTKYTIVQQSLASAERVFGLLDVDEPDAPTGVPTEEGGTSLQSPSRTARGQDAVIRFDRVVFGYRPGVDVLHGIDFSVRRGEKLAIVGATGAGKTTVTTLLLRLHDVRSGSVSVDGVDVRRFDRHALRARFALVPQDAFLFAGTIRENVALGDPRPDDARVAEALRRVGAWELCAARGGLDARCAERGQNFSAGERQLLAFARALYRDAEIVVLDEATANVDSETEHALQAAVDEVLRGRTAIVIAHRLSTIRRADRILVFHGGRIVEQGTHEALLAAGGVYARLHRLQFGDPASDATAAQ
jgi:ATP-binding cassette subfamily B protein